MFRSMGAEKPLLLNGVVYACGRKAYEMWKQLISVSTVGRKQRIMERKSVFNARTSHHIDDISISNIVSISLGSTWYEMVSLLHLYDNFHILFSFCSLLSLSHYLFIYLLFFLYFYIICFHHLFYCSEFEKRKWKMLLNEIFVPTMHSHDSWIMTAWC